MISMHGRETAATVLALVTVPLLHSRSQILPLDRGDPQPVAVSLGALGLDGSTFDISVQHVAEDLQHAGHLLLRKIESGKSAETGC